jgi:hypothetical protein
MFIIHGSQGLGNGNPLARGQVCSWLNCAKREGERDKSQHGLQICDDILKSGKKIFWKHILKKYNMILSI